MVRQITSAASHSSNRHQRRAQANQPNPNAATGTENAAAAKHGATEAEATRIATLTAETPGTRADEAGKANAAKIIHLLTANTEAERAKMTRKAELLGSARQALAEAKSYYDQGTAKETEAEATAERGLAGLYQARAQSLITQDELSTTLGDIFGWKAKPDGKPSKTPDKQGEVMRKRIVRAVAAKEFVETGDGGRFFADVPVELIAPVVERLDANDVSLWTAYNTLADIKREAAADKGRVDPALNPKIMAGVVERLGKPDALEIIANNPALKSIYSALLDQLLVIDGQKAMTAAAEALETAQKEAAKKAA